MKETEAKCELPNTGTKNYISIVAFGFLGVLSGFILIDRKKKVY